jgi:predicted glutamine amidotransferase
MCGIIYAEDFNGNPVNKLVMNQFEAQRARGKDGFGIFDKTNNRLIRATKERKILSWLKRYPQPALMFHHRFPTSTMNRRKACHPFSTKNHFDTNYVLIHNGHIINSRTLKTDHEELGIEYKSWLKDEGKFNDSEALLWDVALYLENKQDKLKAYGNIAFICLAIPKDKRKPTKLYFGRNHNPLKMSLNDSQIFLSSEGEGEEITPHTLYSYNYRTKKLDKVPVQIPSKYESEYQYTGGCTNSGFHNWGREWNQQQTPADFWAGENDDTSDQYWENDDDYSYTPSRYSDFELLDDTEAFNWASLFPHIQQELVYSKQDGTVINVKQTIVDRIESYLETSDGYYMDAYSLINYDIHVLKRQLAADRVFKRPDDEDLVLEIDMLVGAREAFDTNYLWAKEDSKDPTYA